MSGAGPMLQRVARYFSARPLLLLLLNADFVFIAVHVWLWTKGNVPWDQRDGSNPEKLQYVKWLTSTLFCAWAFARQRDALYLAWAALFFYLLLDDSLELHETISDVLAQSLQVAARYGLRGRISWRSRSLWAPPRYCSV